MVMGTLVLGLGIVADVFAAQYDSSVCGDDIFIFFVGMGVVYSVAGFCELLVALLLVCCDNSQRTVFGLVPLYAVHCAGIPAFVFLILGSVWTWGNNNQTCRHSTNPWLRSHIYLIVLYAVIGLNICCSILLLAVGNSTKQSLTLRYRQEDV